MDYLCILNAFEQTYYNRIKEIERVAAAAAATHGTSSFSSASSSFGGGSSSASSTPTSSTASSPTTPATIAANNSKNSPHHYKMLQQHSTATLQHLQQLQQQNQRAAYSQQQHPPRHLTQQQHMQLQQHHRQHQQYSEQQQHQQQQQQHNSNVANSLLWQPWRDFQQAAAMHQHFYQQQLQKESRLTTKELPTTKWRRDRRLRAAEYIQSPSNSAALGGIGIATSTSSTPPPPPTTPPQPLPLATHVAPPTHSTTQMSMIMAAAAAASSMRPLCESTNRPSAHHSPTTLSNSIAHSLSHESPIDMSVSSTTMKQRASPPPPYREPLPGSTYATSLARPSVITQAPPKRGNSCDARDNILISNRENDNRSSESISMCETVIDEHFRRSLGPDYVALFSKKSPAPTTPSPQPMPHGITLTALSSPPPSHASHMSIYPPMTLQQQQPQHHYQHSPPHHLQHPQALIAPKSTTLLLSPTIAGQVKSDMTTAQLQHSPTILPPPQQQPLALQRNTASASPQRHLLSSPSAGAQLNIATPLIVQRSAVSAKSPAASPTTSSSSPRPLSPTPAPTIAAVSSVTLASNIAASAAPPSQQQLPSAANKSAFMRIKTEPGLTTAINNSSSPASPASSSSLQSETPSVDDHFAKALGDTWKKLQQSKELRK